MGRTFTSSWSALPGIIAYVLIAPLGQTRDPPPPTLQQRCDLLLQYIQTTNIDQKTDELMAEHRDFIRELYHKDRTRSSEELSEAIRKHLHQASNYFNTIHQNSSLLAVFKTDPKTKKPYVEITSKQVSPPPEYQNYFERLFWQLKKSSPETKIIFDPETTAATSARGLHDRGTNTIYPSVEDLLSVNTVPSIFLHEYFHRVIFKKNIENSPGFQKYAGNVTGQPSWASSSYLNRSKYLSMSETQTFWVTLRSEQLNIKKLLASHDPAKPVARALRRQVANALSDLRQLNAVLQDSIKTHSKVVNTLLTSADANTQIYKFSEDRARLTVRLTEGAANPTWVEMEIPYEGNPRYALQGDRATPTEAEATAIAGGLNNRRNFLLERLAGTTALARDIEKGREPKFIENISLNPELISNLSDAQILELAKILSR